MTVSDLVRYGWLVATHPTKARFINEGIGIDARHKRCAKFWAPHLTLTKNFIIENLNRLQTSSLTVLGAGALLDFPDYNSFPTSLRKITFVDGNPGHISNYRKLSKKFLTRGIKVRWKIVDLLQTSADDLRDDTILSLNLISQLALVTPTSQNAAQQHLDFLAAAAKRAVILIGDRTWFSYTPDKAEWSAEDACPGVSNWQVDGMNEVARNQWLWHVAPYGIERDDCGLIHEVHARCFEKI